MTETLSSYVRIRAQTLGISTTELCRRAKLSRQTLHSLLNDQGAKLPSLQTVVALAQVLQVHPLRLLQLLFDEHPPLASKRNAPSLLGDQSAFVRDVNFADGALVLPGQRFVKTWEVQNVGRVAWQDRFMQCMDEELIVQTRDGRTIRVADNLIPTSTLVPIPNTEPGQTVMISVELTAPHMPGTLLSYWKSVFADGTLCFPEAQGLSAKVRVSTLATASQEMR
ncbi:NBR1-Ig-like domain-containing protein [Roseateles albus]|uniref:NBR1-Ig-like domain-containing protein n=1 Tax=Roseateles albus TaxID=2987525 RepID=A0ABT5KKT8_9BURK|nr:NBR1-Ig-like domain-containing protein [Roseateles albus]MDC8774564.1 NBR1-Ig-like domain-containing protein [Roseateles albus]